MKRFVKGVLNMTVSRAFCAAMFVCVAGSIVVVDAAEYSAQVIKVYDEDEVAALEEAGAQILRRRGDILLCYIPKEDNGGVVIPNSFKQGPEELKSQFKLKARNKDVAKEDTFRGFNVPTLDVASTYYEASKIITGEAFGSPYTGKGIVAGFCDVGFDPLHPTFLDKNGVSRVKRITQYIENKGLRIVVEGDEAYEEWGTDDSDNYHATHVGGIMAGNGAGSPYVGIARDADIVVSTSTLTDVGLLAGVEDIIDYAKEVGKPCVINLSMGNYIGAHDGTSLFSQYLDMCAEDAIIVLSSGNEGNRTNTLAYKFTEEKPSVGFRLGNRAWDQKNMYGITDIWSSDSRPFSIQVSLFDDETKKVVYSYEPVEFKPGYEATSVRYEWNPDEPEIEGNALNGYLTAVGALNRENGRYEVALMYEYESTALIGSGWARDMVSVTVTGEPGSDVEIYADGSYTRLMTLPGSPSPNADRSISDLVCGERVVSVGMYGNRSSIPVSVIDESTGEYVIVEEPTQFKEGATVNYSSYGTLRDGRVLPLTVAPGGPLVSAVSRYYLDRYSDDSYLKLDAPWKSQPGTSMSSPYVAGYIATWLEALPGLTVHDVQALIASTNHLADIAEPDDPHNANGYFDPLAALRKALKDSGVNQIERPDLLLRPDDPVSVYSLSGLKVYEGRYDGTCNLVSGIYILDTPFGKSKMKIGD